MARKHPDCKACDRRKRLRAKTYLPRRPAAKGPYQKRLAQAVAWLDKATRPGEFAKRFIVCVRRLLPKAGRFLLNTRVFIAKLRRLSVLQSRARVLELQIPSGYFGRNLATSVPEGPDAVEAAEMLGLIVSELAVAYGRECWSSRGRRLGNITDSFRYFFSAVFRVPEEYRPSVSQGSNKPDASNYDRRPPWVSPARTHEAESVSDWDGDPAGEPGTAWRQGAAERAAGFFDAVAKKHPALELQAIRFYCFARSSRERAYKLFNARKARLCKASKKPRKSAMKRK